jgi:hypothetical protein
MAGIMPSAAARIVDNAFMSIGYSEDDLALVNYGDKIGSYCRDQFQFDAVIDYIRSNDSGGLPKIGHKIEWQYIRDVSRDSTYGLLVSRVCKFAEPTVIP